MKKVRSPRSHEVGVSGLGRHAGSPMCVCPSVLVILIWLCKFLALFKVDYVFAGSEKYVHSNFVSLLLLSLRDIHLEL